MITLFGTLKPKYDYRQHNAIKSWVSLPRCRVLLIGKEAQPAIDEFGAGLVVDVQRSESGIPQVDSLFGAAQAWSPDNLFLYANADIILWDDIILSLETCAREFSQFLMVGQRTDLVLPGPIDCGEYRLRTRAGQGRLLSPCGCDYFGFTRGLWPEILPFVVGRMTFDNWLIWSALEAKRPVIDVTKAVTAVHQEHPEDRLVRIGPDAAANRALAPRVGKGHVGWVSHSTYVMNSTMQIEERK